MINISSLLKYICQKINGSFTCRIWREEIKKYLLMYAKSSPTSCLFLSINTPISLRHLFWFLPAFKTSGIWKESAIYHSVNNVFMKLSLKYCLYYIMVWKKKSLQNAIKYTTFFCYVFMHSWLESRQKEIPRHSKP